MARTIKVVMTGRLMKISENPIAYFPCAGGTASSGSLASSAGLGFAAVSASLTWAPGLSMSCPSVTTFSPGSSPLATMVFSSRVSPVTTGRKVDFHLGVDDVDVVAVLAGLDGGGGHDDGVFAHGHLEHDPHELAGPQVAVLVWEGGLQAGWCRCRCRRRYR